MKKKVLNIEGMTCSACSNGLEKYLNKQEGIAEANVNLVMATASVSFDENKLTEKDLERFVKEAGFKSLGEFRAEKGNKKELKLILFFTILILFCMYISMGSMANLPIPSAIDKNKNPKSFVTILFIVSVLAIMWGFDIIKNGAKNIIHKMPNMDSLVGVGVLVNFLFSVYNAVLIFMNNGDLSKIYFESSIMIILFIKIGRYIDKKNKSKAVDTIKNLVTITPKNGTILKSGKEVAVTINEIQKDDIVVCKPGEKIAVDGTIVNGMTHTDESFITGESKPVSKKVGSNVMAGSVNYDGYIEYKAVNIGKDSNISHIVDLVVEATNTKAPIARMADKISGYFVPFIFIIAVLSFILNYVITKEWSSATVALVSVLVVACPCALGLATPLAMVVSIGNASKRGIVIKSSESIESINKTNAIVFDKTGTLTKGALEIVDQKYNYGKTDKEDLFKILQSIESKSNHPLAKSICKNASELYKVEDFEELAGNGVKAKVNGKIYYAGNRKFLDKFELKNKFQKEEQDFATKGESIVYFWNEKEALGIFELRDEIKPQTKEAVNDLKKLGKKVIMLSGDNETTAKTIAKVLEIDEVYSNVSPNEKLEKIKSLSQNGNVIMVGDGINDSPALKTASIGISVSNGTDISSDSADIILLSDDMHRIVDLFNIGKKTIRVVKQNLFWALFYNVLMIPLATGLLPMYLNPMIASVAMTFSSLTVVLNSLRLRK